MAGKRWWIGPRANPGPSSSDGGDGDGVEGGAGVVVRVLGGGRGATMGEGQLERREGELI